MECKSWAITKSACLRGSICLNPFENFLMMFDIFMLFNNVNNESYSLCRYFLRKGMERKYLFPHFLMQLRRYSQTVCTSCVSLWQKLCSRGRRDWMREQEAWSRVSSALPMSCQLSSDSHRIRSTRLISSSLVSFKANFSVRFWRKCHEEVLLLLL